MIAESYEVRVQRAIEAWIETQKEGLTWPLGMCESPAEQIFLLAFLTKRFRCVRLLDRGDESSVSEALEALSTTGFTYPVACFFTSFLYCQLPLKLGNRRLRLDFALIGKKCKLAIEVDGHEWHERSEQQSRRDKSRDRLLQSHGWVVFRFTAAEVWKDAGACVEEVFQAFAQRDWRDGS